MNGAGMAGVRGLAVLHRRAADRPAGADADLLARFVATSDGAAFAELVRRHGPLVAAVCRRHLRQPADVDDAVQATFLVFARKAGTVRTAVGPWLYRVAGRTANKLRRAQRPTQPLPEVPAKAGGLPPDVRAVVADELQRLPERYRLVVELCYVAGHTTAEAADRLGWPRGTVLTRLAWARRRLRANLTRRGVTLGGSLGLVLLDRTAARGVRLAAEPGRVVLTLYEGVTRTMRLTKLVWAGGLTAVAVAGLGAGTWAVGQPPGDRPAVPRVEPRPPDSTPPLLPPRVIEPPAPDLVPPTPPPSVQADLPRTKLPSRLDVRPAGKTFTVAAPSGGYVREFAGGERIRLQFADDHLSLTVSVKSGDKTDELHLEADCSVNKEGVVFGVVTLAESSESNPDTFQQLVGEPLALRVRVDNDTLTVKDVRGPVFKELGAVTRAVLGRYAAAGAEPVGPARKVVKPKFESPGTTVPASGPPVPRLPGLPQPPLPPGKTM